jgi:hypothetical protein
MMKEVKKLSKREIKDIYEDAEDEIENFHTHDQEKLKKKVQTYRKFIKQNLHKVF